MYDRLLCIGPKKSNRKRRSNEVSGGTFIYAGEGEEELDRSRPSVKELESDSQPVKVTV